MYSVESDILQVIRKKVSYVTFGERIRLLRDKKGYTQKYIASKIGVKNNTLHGYENGLREPPFEILVQLAEIYEVTVDYLLGRSSDPRLTKEQEEQVDKRTKELMDLFNRLGEKDQVFFKQTMENFIQTHKKEQ